MPMSIGGIPYAAWAQGLALRDAPGSDIYRAAGYASRDAWAEAHRFDPSMPQDIAETSPEGTALNASAAQYGANAAAETARAGGLAQEADAYRIAAGIAGSSASLEDQATAITRFQQQRAVRSTVAGQRADVASAGFRESGSSLSLLRESISQGAITDALTSVQGNINANGYRAQQAAAVGEQEAALSSSAAATALAAQYASAGTLATSLSANLAGNLVRSRVDFNAVFDEMGGTADIGGGINVRGGGGGGGSGRDPFLIGALYNPAYTGQGGGGGIGTGTVATTPSGEPVQRGVGDVGGGAALRLPPSGGGDTGGGGDYGGGGDVIE